ncbi:cupin domain-containing protein [Lentzea sp. NPDC003310]|uniref:polysaccharide biosynthesis C-terminal domain-containing protein n=1 Tax=Lentzea sp. NPDC003310 TaxID=3154447 RepID=UPI0033B7820C
MVDRMQIVELDCSTDDRGFSFSVLRDQLGLIGPIQDVHIAEIRPGAVRGNHFHAHRGELIAVVATGRWSVHWDTGEGTEVHSRSFDGNGAVAVVPPRGWSHAVKNDGDESMWIYAASDATYDRHDPDPVARDAVRRVVVRP